MRKANRTSCRIHPTTARARIRKIVLERAFIGRKIAALRLRAFLRSPFFAQTFRFILYVASIRAEISARACGEKMRWKHTLVSLWIPGIRPSSRYLNRGKALSSVRSANYSYLARQRINAHRAPRRT